MPSPIPVQIAEHEFPSINKARIHYCTILHSYRPGEKLTPLDEEQVLTLLECSGTLAAIGTDRHHVRVIQGYFGKPCFAARSENSPSRVMSIARSLARLVGHEKPRDEYQDLK